MKKLFYFLTLVCLFLLFQNKVVASHVTGGDISYQCTSTPGTYKVTVKLYRDCAGINICPGCTNTIPTGSVSGCTIASAGITTQITGLSTGFNGFNYGSFVLTAVTASSGYEIIQTCPSVSTICTNCNTRTAGTYSPAIEVYTFEGDVNLSSIPTGCCKVAFSISVCCRNNALTTMPSGNFYTEAVVDRCIIPCNSAPIFTNDAPALLCANADFIYNLGALDPDGDSLSYAFGQSLQGVGSAVSYFPPYSAGYPFPYFGAPNANAAYPAGLRIDPTTGDILFRPMGLFVSSLVIEVKQWKLVGGVRVNVGITRRDIQLQTQTCLSNRAPIIKLYRNGILNVGSNNITVEAGKQICLDIVAQDQELLTNTPPIIADTTVLSWNNPNLNIPAMANATFTRNYILAQRGINGPKADSFKFCWTPPVTAIRTEPYLFTVSGLDRFCPIKAAVIRGVCIKVDSAKAVYITSALKTNFCNNQTSNTSVNYNVVKFNPAPTNVFSVQLSDSLGSFNSFTTIGTKTDSLKMGSINITIPSGLSANGTYKLRINNTTDTSALAEPFAIIIWPTFTKPVITVSKDSFCKGTGNAIFSVLPTNSNYSFKWLINNILASGATNDSLLSDTTAAIKAIVSNGGCVDTSFAKTITVYSKATNVNFTANVSTQCLNGNNFSFTNNSLPNNGTLTYLWKFSNGDTSTFRNPIKVFTNAGTFIAKMIVKNNTNCVDSFQSNLIVNASPLAKFSIADSTKCLTGNSFIFVNSSTGASSYNWAFGDNTNSTLTNATKTYSNAGIYIAKLVATANGCTDSITKTVTVLANATNVNYTTNQATQCLNENNFSFTNNSLPNNSTLTYLWNFSNGDTSTMRNPIKVFTNAGTYVAKMIVTANNKCVDSFQSNIIVNASPKARFTMVDSTKCLTGNSFNFVNSSIGATSYNWAFGDNTNSTLTTPNKTYTNAGNYIVKLVSTANGCTDSITKTVTVLANATNVDFTTNQATQCLGGNNFSFTNNSLPNNSTLRYLWKFSNGDTSTLRNPIKSFSNVGTYVAKMIITANNKCVDSFQSAITVLPNIQIGAILGNLNPSNITSPFSYSVFNKPNTTFNWSTTNSTIQSGQGTNQISVIFSNPGNAKIAAKITDNNGCSDSTSLNISVSVGINELSLANDLRVYPNPTKSIVTITNKTNLIGKKYVITNLIGQIVLSGKLNIDETIINTESLTNGVYLLSIEGLNKQAIKVIKE